MKNDKNLTTMEKQFVLLDQVITNADDYTTMNINGLLNVAIENPELFERLYKIIKADKEYAFMLSIAAAERIEELGL